MKTYAKILWWFISIFLWISLPLPGEPMCKKLLIRYNIKYHTSVRNLEIWKDSTINLWEKDKKCLLRVIKKMLKSGKVIYKNGIEERDVAVIAIEWIADPIFKKDLMNVFSWPEDSFDENSLFWYKDEAMSGLTEIYKKKKDPEIPKFLMKVAVEDSDKEIQWEAVYMLGEIREPKAFHLTIKKVFIDNKPGELAFYWAQYATITLCRTAPPESALPYIFTDRLMDYEFQWNTIPWIIKEEYGIKAIPVLKSLIKNSKVKPMAKKLAKIICNELEVIKYVYGFEKKRDETALISGLKSKRWLVRRYCAEALGRIGTKKAILPLKSLFNDPYLYISAVECEVREWYWVRKSAWEAYLKISKRYNLPVDMKDKPLIYPKSTTNFTAP